MSPKTTGLILCHCIWLVMTACTTPATRVEAPAPAPTSETTKAQKTLDQIDLASLVRSLRMDRGPSELGYQEKPFNPCDFGVSSDVSDEASGKPQHCRQQTLVVVHFQLQCRDQDGTVETYNVTPITAEEIKWSVGKHRGITHSDHEGLGEFMFIAASSQRSSHLKLTIGNNFMILRADEIKKVVTPPAWCGGPE